VTGLYDPFEPELVAARARAKALLVGYNRTTAGDEAERATILAELFGAIGPGAWIEPPFFCDYGSNLHAGERLYANTGCVVLDCATVRIGDRVMLAPYVQLITATHPLDAAERAGGLESAEPITVGDDVWIGAGAIVLPGISIGPRSVVGAGAVVTRDVPADTLVAGNPARPLRTLAGGSA
jgi:maltose O-acetyltransferase